MGTKFDYTSTKGILEAVRQNIKANDDTENDNMIRGLITGVLTIFNSDTQRSFDDIVNFEYQKFISYQGIRKVTVPFAPIVSITSIGDASEDIEYDEDDNDFKLNKNAGIIVFQYGLPVNVMLTITGKHGYDEIPQDIGVSCATQVTFLFEKRGGMAKRSKSTGQGDVTYEEKVKILEICERVLKVYKL